MNNPVYNSWNNLLVQQAKLSLYEPCLMVLFLLSSPDIHNSPAHTRTQARTHKQTLDESKYSVTIYPGSFVFYSTSHSILVSEYCQVVHRID